MFFEQFERYKIASMFIELAVKKSGLECPSILEIGSDGVNCISEFLPQVRWTPMNISKENIRTITDEFIEADATDMHMLKDESFDFVVSLAVLEHVSDEKRKAFISESCRVARIGVFHATPFKSEYISQIELDVSNYHEILFGMKHRWLEEHLENGHPDMKNVRHILNGLNYNYCIFEHMDADIWENFYKLWLFAAASDSPMTDYCDNYYVNKLFKHDFGKNNVFAHIYIAKNSEDTKELLAKVDSAFPTSLTKVQKDQGLSVFREDLYCAIWARHRRRFEHNISRRCILNFVDGVIQNQSTIYLYGVTDNLLLWYDFIKSSRNYPIKVLDSFKSGFIKTGRATVTVESPNTAELSGIKVVVFPDKRYPEIFESLESKGAIPVLYSDIAE